MVDIQHEVAYFILTNKKDLRITDIPNALGKNVNFIEVTRLVLSKIFLKSSASRFVEWTRFLIGSLSKPAKLQKKQCGGVYFLLYGIES